MIRLGLSTYSQLARTLEKDPSLHSEFISCLTTNTTQFFREATHFSTLAKELPALLQSRNRSPGEFRIWCAASSTGQEVWTILMTLLESGKLGTASMKFLASDIDVDCLKQAWRSVYAADHCSGVEDSLLEKYFESADDKDRRTFYRVRKPYRKQVDFARINLVETFPFQKKFDVVFCRNVMIYFDAPTIETIARQMATCIRPGGLLFIGLSEAGAIKNPDFKSISPGVFRRVENSSSSEETRQP